MNWGPYVEHRWGFRYQVELPVRVRTRSGKLCTGILQSVSLSGAFVLVPTPMRALSQIRIQFLGDQKRRWRQDAVDAQIVRVEPGGLAIEWSEFAPSAVRLWLPEREGAYSPRPRRKLHDIAS
jgi:hypothetical protein